MTITALTMDDESVVLQAKPLEKSVKNIQVAQPTVSSSDMSALLNLDQKMKPLNLYFKVFPGI